MFSNTSWLVLSSLLILPGVAAADCAAPADPGVRICAPTPNATVSYVPGIEFNSAPASGAQITKFIVYDNGRDTFHGASGQTGATLIDASINNGTHNIVINAWDSSGNLYKATTSFRVVGEGYPLTCAAPTAPGVNFCTPPVGASIGVNYSVSATAKGSSNITSMRLYVDGVTQQKQSNSNHFNSSVSVGTQGDHKIAIVAWDQNGNAYNSTRVIHSTYTYGYVQCPPRGDAACKPGFDSNVMPAPYSYVDNSFTITSNIINNAAPITTTKAYVDNTLVATSNGPMMTSPVENAPDGTHIITLQAWDTNGVMYRIQYNVNINVAH